MKLKIALWLMALLKDPIVPRPLSMIRTVFGWSLRVRRKNSVPFIPGMPWSDITTPTLWDASISSASRGLVAVKILYPSDLRAVSTERISRGSSSTTNRVTGQTPGPR